MAPVAVDVVTGFLGSGKTTLLRHVLTHGLQGKRVALVVNEIGEIGIDGRVVTGLQAVESMVELSSGCICCSIDEYRFDLAMQEIVATARPDLIVVESTGLADPDPLTYRLRGAGLQLDAVIAVVDVAHLERCLDEAVVTRRQIEAADFLVLSKLDLVDASQAERAAATLTTLNARALQIRAVHGAADADLLFATGVAAFRQGVAAPTSDHRTQDAFAAFAYRSGAALDADRFQEFLATLPADVIRAKGIVRLQGREWQCLFNVTCGRVETTWLKLPPGVEESQAVFIGREVARHRGPVLAALRRCERA
jgi:G3E family GTPase